MIYCCNACHFLFERTGDVNQCPDCGKLLVREATEEEQKEFEMLKNEFENEHE